MLMNTLKKIGDEYLTASQTQSFTDSVIANFIRRDAVAAMKNSIGELANGLLFKGSAGQSQFAEIPWIAIFDPMVTTGASQGYFVCYLFCPEKRIVYLSLNQGATQVTQEFKKKAKEVLRNRASYIVARLPDFAKDLNDLKISFRTGGRYSESFEAGHAIGKTYNIDALPDEDILVQDLITAIHAYQALIYRGGIGDEIDPDETEESFTLTEKRKYSLHRRIDRDANVAKQVKKELGYKCQACDLRFEDRYGKLGTDYIEAHHLVPLSSLEEGKTIPRNPKKDFAVLCSNCHRMIHRLPDPSDLAELRRRIKR